jgi:C1A family cysteine protease
VAQLMALGFADAEQVVAAAAVPGVKETFRDDLGVTNDAFESLLDTARSALSPQRAELTAHPAPADLGLGVPPPTDEMLAAAAATSLDEAYAAEAAVLPAAVNLISLMPPIRNQAARGTCVAFALTALNEYVLRRGGVVRDLSEQHLYYEIKLIDGSPGGCGTYQSKAVNALSQRGQCTESIWPYDPNTPCNNHGTRPDQARPAGLENRLTAYAVPARRVADYKAQLARQRPVTLSIPVYNSWYRSAEARRSGRITMRIGNERADGGHAVCLVGYQDSPSAPGGGYFILRNSWGTTNWAYQSPYGGGYGTIPYQYIANDAWEAYSAVVPVAADKRGDLGGEHVRGEGGKATVTIQAGSNVTVTIESQ